MSGGPILADGSSGFRVVGVVSTDTDAVQLTSGDLGTIGRWEKSGNGGVANWSGVTADWNTPIGVTSGAQGGMTLAGTDEVPGASTLGSTIAKNQTVDFGGGPGAIDLIDPRGFSGQIVGFASPDTIHLSGDWIYLSFSENSAGTLGTLTLQNVASHADISLRFVGDYSKSDFNVASGATTIIGRT
jgi:hypothetical protein